MDIKDILKGSLERLGVAKQVEAAVVVEKATEEIAKFIPKEDFEVVSFKDGVLKIKTANSNVSNEIRYRVSQLSAGVKKIKYV